MSVHNARKFIIRSSTDTKLRDQLNAAPGASAIAALLKEQNLDFTGTQFEEAFSGLLAQSQTEEEAALIRGIKEWWNFLQMTCSR